MKAKAKYQLGRKAEQAVKRLMPAPAGGSNTDAVVDHVYMNATKVYKPKPKRKPKAKHTCHQRAKLEQLARKGQWKKYAELACQLLEQQAASDIAPSAPQKEARPYFKDLPPSSHQQDSEAVKRLTLAGVDQVVDTTAAIIKKQRSMAISKGRAAAKKRREEQARLAALQEQPSIWNR